jgi:hypothetical protein
MSKTQEQHQNQKLPRRENQNLKTLRTEHVSLDNADTVIEGGSPFHDECAISARLFATAGV